MPAHQSHTASPPVELEICGYSVRQTLTPGQSYLAADSSGRRVVLKKMDPDCLLGGDLHPSIRERLQRVRELPHGGVANLHGVGRQGNDAWLIWEFVEGQSFGQYIAAPQRTPRELAALARELVVCIDSLHLQGLVHGAIRGGNVIVTAVGSVRLTHLSPLLYTETGVDIEAALELLQMAGQCDTEEGSHLGLLVAEARQQGIGLREIAARLGAMLEARQRVERISSSDDRKVRRRMLAAALFVAIIGLAVSYGIWRVVTAPSQSSTPQSHQPP